MGNTVFRSLGFVFIALGIFYCQRNGEKLISYNEDIRPIFNAKCLSCHGGVKKSGGFSLLFPEEAYDTTDSGKYGILPGRPDQSELYVRITSEDPELRMPLEHPPLNKEEIATIKKWIEQGAKWETHWSFLPVKENVAIPAIKNHDNWIKNEIDHFVLEKLDQHQLKPKEEAEKPELIRRLALDLTGLPPSDALATWYLNNNQENAYEQLVDTLLSSPHFGEHWASMWLDLARYGDSQGYQKDPLRRTIWRYRDWVIDAFNRNMPFDQFTIEQIAGDLLPDRTDNQLLATAFHRNTNTNDEGGTDDEEFRIVAVLDRVNTTFEVWQGITISCVQCHSHPYDPIVHDEYYKLVAFFNNTQDRDHPKELPLATLLSPGQMQRKHLLQSKIEYWRAEKDTVTDEFKLAIQELESITPEPVPVMMEMEPDTFRKTQVFIRGNWLNRGDEVLPDIPNILNHIDGDVQQNRLGLAKWLVDKKNPLTARVMVNRFWTALFGRGIVETVEDFGSQGRKPTHPEMLEWLASNWMYQHNWDTKALLKDMVMSATYRQKNTVTAEILEKDPYNRLLSHGPRFRLSAEQIRDQALAVSGLLSPKLFGPSVMPYQPEGVWNIIRQLAQWQTSEGEDKHRRAVYTFIRKTSPYPSFITFDSPSREKCLSRRIRTNTPLQALVTMNDPVYIEAAAALAKTMKSTEDGPEAQIAFGYKKALFKSPKQEKMQLLLKFYEEALDNYRSNQEELQLLAANLEIPTAEDAALFNVANVILNLDEFLNN